LNEELLFKLNALELYGKRERPSLAREWLERAFSPIVELSGLPVQDKLRTLVEHAAFQIASVINLNAPEGLVLLSGGGAKNVFLVERLRELSRSEIVVPVDETIDFKEALIFAFLGVLRTENQTNVLQSVTGAKRDSCSGVIHFPRT
jgi:anhydro-N-acetylmuramic acid kinase